MIIGWKKFPYFFHLIKKFKCGFWDDHNSWYTLRSFCNDWLLVGYKFPYFFHLIKKSINVAFEMIKIYATNIDFLWLWINILRPMSKELGCFCPKSSTLVSRSDKWKVYLLTVASVQKNSVLQFWCGTFFTAMTKRDALQSNFSSLHRFPDQNLLYKNP